MTQPSEENKKRAEEVAIKICRILMIPPVNAQGLAEPIAQAIQDAEERGAANASKIFHESFEQTFQLEELRGDGLEAAKERAKEKMRGLPADFLKQLAESQARERELHRQVGVLVEAFNDFIEVAHGPAQPRPKMVSDTGYIENGVFPRELQNVEGYREDKQAFVKSIRHAKTLLSSLPEAAKAYEARIRLEQGLFLLWMLLLPSKPLSPARKEAGSE